MRPFPNDPTNLFVSTATLTEAGREKRGRPSLPMNVPFAYIGATGFEPATPLNLIFGCEAAPSRRISQMQAFWRLTNTTLQTIYADHSGKSTISPHFPGYSVPKRAHFEVVGINGLATSKRHTSRSFGVKQMARSTWPGRAIPRSMCLHAGRHETNSLRCFGPPREEIGTRSAVPGRHGVNGYVHGPDPALDAQRHDVDDGSAAGKHHPGSPFTI